MIHVTFPTAQSAPTSRPFRPRLANRSPLLSPSARSRRSATATRRSRRPDRRGRQARVHLARRSAGSSAHPPRRGACARRSGSVAVAGYAGDHRAGDRERLLLRLLPLRTVHARGFPGDREAHAGAGQQHGAARRVGIAICSASSSACSIASSTEFSLSGRLSTILCQAALRSIRMLSSMACQFVDRALPLQRQVGPVGEALQGEAGIDGTHGRQARQARAEKTLVGGQVGGDDAVVVRSPGRCPPFHRPPSPPGPGGG